MSPTPQRRTPPSGAPTPSSGPDFKAMITIQITQALIASFLASSASEPPRARLLARTQVVDSNVKGIRAGAPKLVSAYRAWYGSRQFGALAPLRSAA